MLRLLPLLLLLSVFVFADSNILVGKKDKYNHFSVSYVKDKTSRLTIEEISRKEFKKTTQNNFALGYIKGKAWFKFSIENKSLNENFILSLNESFYEVANLYYYDKNWIKKSNGVFTPIEKRDIKTNHLAFDITLNPNEKKVYYLELKGKYAYFGNIEIYEKSYYYFDNSMGINTLYIFILGIISIIVLFNFFLYVKTKERIYIYYVGYSFFNIIYLLNISGLLVYVDLQKYIYELQLAASFMLGFLVYFSIEYLEVKKYLTKYHRALKLLALPFFIFGVLVVFSYQPWNQLINNYAGLVCILLIAISTIIYFKGHNKTKYYIFAMLLYFTFIVLFTFMVNGTFEYTNFTRYGFLVTSAIEITIFSFLLANRYNEIKENTQYYLELEVENRTNKLTSLLKERELLLKEVYHRVKNNFHMVIGMLWFQSRKKGNNSQEFKELINRIKSMSMIHEYLYDANNLAYINTKDYLDKIIYNISSGYKNIIFDSDIEDITIEFDHAVSLGVIINEAITNAVKHNINIDSLCIKVVAVKKGNRIYLSIEDNGAGFDDIKQKKGIGIKLIEQFCGKLPKNKYDFSFNNGTKFELQFATGK
ncbi:7TM diverse intracellular signaling domain-containing protein [Sulfurimonas sp.]|uniref:7TM diverse intracellular signaling domain-containing protein n=1 Tax=Sulfurimonas sp. TaxID=2022749 RepID=UPI003569223C